MSEKQTRSLGEVEIPESAYAPDLALLDRYQAFTAEIVRLSILGVALLGFFLTKIVVADSAQRLADPWAGWLLGVAAVVLLAAMGAALRHRYLSTDGIFYHLKAKRCFLAEPPRVREAKEAERSRNRIYAASGRWLAVATAGLWFGGVLVATAFGRILWVWTH